MKTHRLFALTLILCACTGIDPDTAGNNTATASTECFESDLDTPETTLPGLARESPEDIPEMTSPVQFDFSRVGYHWGDDAIPHYPQYGTVLMPTGGDDTEMLQSALDAFPDGGRGAIVLGPGTFRISSILNVRRSGLVLRGSTDGSGKLLTTILWTNQAPADVNTDAIHIGANQADITMFLNWSQSTPILSEHTPVGAMFLYVENPSIFAPGDRVAIHRPCRQNWLDDIKMTLEGGLGTAWRDDDYVFNFYRYVVKVDGQKVYLDNPVVMALDSRYGEGYLVKAVFNNFVKESGVEDIIVDCLYDESETGSDGFGGVCHIDEDHSQSALHFSNAEHCWASGIEAHHMVFSCARFGQRTFYSEILGCKCLDPVSLVEGRRRYAFCIGGGQMCIIRDCYADRSRHSYVTTGQVCGPNVFLRSNCDNNFSSSGPHCNWAMGILYDGIDVGGVDPSRCSGGETYVSSTDKFAGQLQVQDAFTWGATMDQGWEGANHVFWNCDAGIIICQNPWVTSQNWAWGCTGVRKKSSSSATDKNGGRPQGDFNSHGTHIFLEGYESLYEWQLNRRHSSDIKHFVPGFAYN